MLNAFIQFIRKREVPSSKVSREVSSKRDERSLLRNFFIKSVSV
jgi:hypothetical protein